MCLEVYVNARNGMCVLKNNMCVLKTTIGSACELAEPKVIQFLEQSKV